MANGRPGSATYEDITERERAGEQIREAEAAYRRRAEQHRARPVACSTPTIACLVCNDLYVDIFGADPDVVKPGITLRGIFEHGVGRGAYPGPHRRRADGAQACDAFPKIVRSPTTR